MVFVCGLDLFIKWRRRMPFCAAAVDWFCWSGGEGRALTSMSLAAAPFASATEESCGPHCPVQGMPVGCACVLCCVDRRLAWGGPPEKKAIITDRPPPRPGQNTATRTDGHGGEEDGPEDDEDVAAVDVAGAVVHALRVRLVIVRDLLGPEPVGVYVCFSPKEGGGRAKQAFQSPADPHNPRTTCRGRTTQR